MTPKEKYLEQFAKNLLAAIELTKKKNKDYAGDEDPFKNFRESAEAASLPGQEPISLEQTILVRLADKDSRIRNLLSRPNMEGDVADEKITDTLMDRIVYTNILLVWLQLGRPSLEELEDILYNEELQNEDEEIQEHLEQQDARLAATQPAPGKSLSNLFGWNKKN